VEMALALPHSQNSLQQHTDRAETHYACLAYRKSWIALIMHRINSTWNKYNIQNYSQQGSHSARGTDTALIGLQAMFEQASETDSPLLLSSWDISKAFDSLCKNDLRFSWSRLGIPTHISDFFLALDEYGHTIVRTPFSQQLRQKRKNSGVPSGNPKKARMGCWARGCWEPH